MEGSSGHLAWRRTIVCRWPWKHLGNPTRAAEGRARVPGRGVWRSGTAGTRRAEAARDSKARAQRGAAARRLKSTNPYTRSQEKNCSNGKISPHPWSRRRWTCRGVLCRRVLLYWFYCQTTGLGGSALAVMHQTRFKTWYLLRIASLKSR